MDELSMDEIKISDMDEETEFTNENYETEEPIYEDDDLSSVAMPVISDMDAVVDYTGVQYEAEEDASSDAANRFSQTGDGLDSVAMPVFSDMDAAAVGGEVKQPESSAAEADIDPVAAPAADDMYEKPAASSSPKAPKLVKPQTTEKSKEPSEKNISAMERRMAEPFDMPGAYVPGEQNAPSKYVPKPPAPPAEQNNSAYTQNQPETRTNTSTSSSDFLDNLYGDRQEHYDKGAKKAKILGIITIVLAVLTFISSMSNSRADSWDKIIAVATVIVTPLCAWKFMKGSNGCRRVLGIISLCDAGKSVMSIVAPKGLVSLINKGLGTTLSINPFIIFLIVLEAIGFAAMAYFFLIDKQVSDFTTDD